MLAGTLKSLLVAAAVVMSFGATPVDAARAPAPPRAHHAPLDDEGCRELPTPAEPASAPPAPATCS